MTESKQAASAFPGSSFPGLSGRVAVVTGGSGAIGGATARALARNGAAVAVSGRNMAALDQVVASIRHDGGRAVAAVADVTDPEALRRLRSEAERQLGPVDLVAAVAGGLGNPVALTELPLERWRESLDVNLTSAFLTFQTFLPGMVERGRGALVTVSSTAGRQPSQASPAYGAAKAGLLMLTRQAAREVAGRGVRINAVAPGATFNERLRQAPPQAQEQAARAHPLGRIGEPEEIAEAILYLLSDASSFVTGATLDVNGGRLMV